MGNPCLPAHRVCRLCLKRTYSSRNGGAFSAKAVPLRVFTAELEAVGSRWSRAVPGRSKTARTSTSEKRETSFIAGTTSERSLKQFSLRPGKPGLSVPQNQTLLPTPGGNKVTMHHRMPQQAPPDAINKISPQELLESADIPEAEGDVLDAIEECVKAALRRLNAFRPLETPGNSQERIPIPHDQYMWLCSILQFQFTKSQLVEYGHRHGLVKSFLTTLKTMDVLNQILEQVWNLQKEGELPPDEALITKRTGLRIVV
jgi:hypothetical protein